MRRACTVSPLHEVIIHKSRICMARTCVAKACLGGGCDCKKYEFMGACGAIADALGARR